MKEITAEVKTFDAGQPNSFRIIEFTIPKGRHWETRHSTDGSVTVYRPTDAELAAIAYACRPATKPADAAEIEALYGR